MESWNPSKEKLIYNPTTVLGFFLNFVILFACHRRQVKKIKTILMFRMRYKNQQQTRT